MDFISEKWDEITDKMRNEFNISNVSFETWIKPLKECCVKEDVVYIIIPDVNAGMSEYINSKYKSLFQVTISEMFDHTYNVEFVIEKDVSSLLKRGRVYYTLSCLQYQLWSSQFKSQI